MMRVRISSPVGAADEQTVHLQNLACMLHATIYALCGAWRTCAGGADWEKVLREMHSMVRRLRWSKPELADVRNVIATLEKSGIYQKVELTSNKEGYTFKIGKCLLAGGPAGVHNTLSPADVPCPVAIFVAAHLALEKRPMKAYLHPTTYYDEGAVTKIELLSPPNYHARIEREKSLSKALRKSA